MPLIPNCSTKTQCGSNPWGVEVSSNVAVNGSVLLPTELVPRSLPRFNVTANVNVSLATAGFEAADPAK